MSVVYDDLIGSGATMGRVAATLAERGAAEVHLAATHGLFSPAAAALFEAPEVSSVVVTDSVAPRRLPSRVVGAEPVVLGLAPLLAAAIDEMSSGGSVSDLLDLPT